MLLSQPTLVLNRSWQAITATSARHAIVLVCSERARIIAPDTYDLHDLKSWADLSRLVDGPKINSVAFSLAAPELILLTNSNVYPRASVVFSRRNIFKRDLYTCQYCGARPGIRELTIDHIHPRSQGGLSCWENCVVSCRQCNERKGSLSLFDSGLKLLRAPKQPVWLPFVNPSGFMRPTWEKFLGDLYWNVELEK